MRGFKGTILKGLGLDRFPQLKEEYFRNYKRIVYLAQNPDPDLIAQAQQAADYLGLPLDLRTTGYGLLEERLVTMMNERVSPQISQMGTALYFSTRGDFSDHLSLFSNSGGVIPRRRVSIFFYSCGFPLRE